MSIFCIGVNHKTAPVEIRERLAFSQKNLPESLAELCQLAPIEGIVVLSTCNRVEIYGSTDQTPTAATNAVKEYLIDHFDIGGQPVEFYNQEDASAVNHLFEVTSGLDSMVLGETEILGQVKSAYQLAHETATTTNKQLNQLFQQSFRVAKLVRNNSRIQTGSTSIGSVAVDVAAKIFGNLKRSKVMIIGAGEMSRTTAQSLISRGASGIIVSNRSYDKAEELADQLGGEAMRFDDWESRLNEVDILIGSTAAPYPIIKRDAIAAQMKKRRGRELFLIDIAVPRDIEDDVRTLDNVYLYNIDQLTQIAAEGRTRRQEQIKVCRQLIADFIEEKGIDALRQPPASRSASRNKDQPPTEPVVWDGKRGVAE